MATHSSILAWKIPCTKESGGLQSMALQRVRHDWPTCTYMQHTSLDYGCPQWLSGWRICLQGKKHGFYPWRRKWQPAPVFLPEKALWTEEPGMLTLHGVTRVRHNWVTKYAAHILRLILPWFAKRINLLLSVYVVQTCTLIVKKKCRKKLLEGMSLWHRYGHSFRGVYLPSNPLNYIH